MSRSTDPGHFFQTDTSLSEAARKKTKSTNNAGNPIHLNSKLLAAIANDEDGGRSIFLAEAAGTVRRVELETGETSSLYIGPTSPIACVALSSLRQPGISRTIFAGAWDKSIWSWDVVSRKQKTRYLGHGDFVKALVCLTIGGREILVSGGADAKIIIWDVRTGKILKQLKGHARGILSLAVDPTAFPDGLQGQSVNEVTLWSADSTRELRRWKITAASNDGEITAAEISENSLLVPHETSVNSLFFDSSIDVDLWTASADKTAKCLARQRNWEVDTTLEHPDFVRDIVVDEDGGWVVTACRDEEVRVWERGSGELYHIFTGHFEEVTGLVLLPNQRIASISIDATVRQWSLTPEDLRKAKVEAEISRTEDPVQVEEKKESMLTEDEERELAELMDDSD